MSNSKIDDIIQLYKSVFPMGWIDNNDWESEGGETAFNSIQERITSFDSDFFYLFSQSVLSGEYHIQSDLSSKLDCLYDLLSNGVTFVNDANSFKNIVSKTFNDVVNDLQGVIMDYRHLLSELYNKYEERSTKYILNAYRDLHRFNHGILNRSRYIRYYTILLEITRIDHLLSYDKKSIMDLILYHTELSEELNEKSLDQKNRLVLDVLNEKSLFLLKKILLEEGKEFDYLIDFKHIHYDTGQTKFKYFTELDRYFEFYRSESYNNDSLVLELDKKARNKELLIGQFALLMKYYKDSKNTSQMQIDNILKDFNTFHDDLTTKFTKRPLDRYALGTLKNYMYNCRFSFMMNQKGYSFEQLKKDLDEITQIQYLTGILNFYPYRKAFKKALDFFHNAENPDKDTLRDYKVFLDFCIAKFSEAIQWCKAYCFYPIQMAYLECLVKVDDFGEVFVASSFCKPVSYKILKEELDNYRNQSLLVDNEIAIIEERVELKKLKKDIDNSKTREVEILSFFVGIITFLFGTIGFFANIGERDFTHLLFSIFGLGAILLIFVSGIHLVTMRKEERFCDYFKHPRAVFCAFTILISIGLLIWLMIKINILAAS